MYVHSFRLGSEVAASHLADHNCPTCRQSLDPVEAPDLGPSLDIDETVALLNSQITTTQRMRDQAQTVAAQAANAYAAMQRQADQLRTTIKEFQAEVLAPADSPSSGDVAKRVTLQLRHDELLRIQDSLSDRFEELQTLSERIAETRTEIGGLPTDIPEQDVRRLSEVTSAMRQRLSVTRFGSYDVNQLSLDQETLRPAREQFDIDTDVSASDVVRIKVAYLDAIRVVGEASGRHPGLLILDEPRQQDIDPVDYSAMLRYLRDSTGENDQTIITSATPRDELDTLIPSSAGNFLDLGSARLLQRDIQDDPLDTW